MYWSDSLVEYLNHMVGKSQVDKKYSRGITAPVPQARVTCLSGPHMKNGDDNDSVHLTDLL